MVAANSRWIIGNGDSIHLWLDNWMGVSLVSFLELPPQMFPSLKARLASVIVDGNWHIPHFIHGYPQVAE
jgi:hypothetical protein